MACGVAGSLILLASGDTNTALLALLASALLGLGLLDAYRVVKKHGARSE